MAKEGPRGQMELYSIKWSRNMQWRTLSVWGQYNDSGLDFLVFLEESNMNSYKLKLMSGPQCQDPKAVAAFHPHC
jgi:hypothetical protein